MPSSHLILCCPLLLPPSIFPSIRVFSNESVLPIRWPKYWSFSFSISPSNEYSWLISFGKDWFDLEVQGTLKSLLQCHSSKETILQHSTFFMVQFSHLYMTTGKTIALAIHYFVGKVMSLLFNTLSRLVIAFLPRSKYVLICSSLRTKAQAGIRIARRNINNLRYADNTTLMAESKEELKSLLMKVKGAWESWLKTQHSNSEDHGIWSHHFMANRETMETVTVFIFFSSKITADGDCSHEIKRCLLLGRKLWWT